MGKLKVVGGNRNKREEKRGRKSKEKVSTFHGRGTPDPHQNHIRSTPSESVCEVFMRASFPAKDF